MKKFGIIALAALLVVVFTMPAAALENKFGGYFRTRFITQQNFTGEDVSEARDLRRVDSRTRLYYTAILNDNLKFVNKFEFDSAWGDTGYGDIGADGQVFEIKNSYIDFNLGSWNAKMGAQGLTLARGFLFADDFSGLNATYKADSFSIPFIWIKVYEGGMGQDMNDYDVDMYGLNPSFSMGDGMTINPILLYLTSDNFGPTVDELTQYYVGVNVDAKLGDGSIWATGILQGGDIDYDDGSSVDSSAYLFAVGGSVPMGAANLHGQIFYATGDDDAADNDHEAFTPPPGRSYYWAEIMGYGMFDQQASVGSPADGITNIMAGNIGVSFKATDQLKLTCDVWMANLAEEDYFGDDDLGTEVDLMAKYKLMEGLNLDVVAAMLFAGDATNGGADAADPYEVGARLSISF